MPFCPICKSEYKEGITTCHECKVQLVDDLSKGPSAVLYGEKEKLEDILAFCKSNGLMTGFIRFSEEQNAEQLYFEQDELPSAMNYIKMYMTRQEMERLAKKAGIPIEEMTPEKAKELLKEEAEEMEEYRRMQREQGKGQNTYVDKRVKAGEYKSSGIVLMLVGGIGLIALLLMYFGVIPGFHNLKSNYMFLGVMGFLFIVFIISGIMSFAKVKTILGQAKEDEDLTKKAETFMAEKLTKEAVDRAAGVTGDGGGEELYFRRAEYMEAVLKEAFPDMEETLREKLIDERYSELYEDNDH